MEKWPGMSHSALVLVCLNRTLTKLLMFCYVPSKPHKGGCSRNPQGLEYCTERTQEAQVKTQNYMYQYVGVCSKYEVQKSTQHHFLGHTLSIGVSVRLYPQKWAQYSETFF